MSAPNSTSNRTVVPVYDKKSGKWEFSGTAVFINSSQMLTARHVVDPYNCSQGVYTFHEPDDADRMILFPDNAGNYQDVSIEICGRHPRGFDVALLKLSANLPGPSEPVVWIQNIVEQDWNERVAAVSTFRVRGFPKNYEPMPGTGGPAGQPGSFLFTKVGPAFESMGMISGGLFEGKTKAGTSGGPVFYESSGGSYCFGLASLGGDGSHSATFLGEGSILPWLKDLEVEFEAVDLLDLRDERLNGYLQTLEGRTRDLLVPVLGQPATDELTGQARNYYPEIDDFVRLFVRLHAHPFGSSELPVIRPEAVEFVYNAVLRGRERSNSPLRPFAEATRTPGDTSWKALRLVKRAIETCAGCGDKPASPSEATLKELSGGEKLDFPAYCRFVREQKGQGMQLVDQTHVWDALIQSRHLVLTGPAGGGKTTVAMFLALALAKPPVERTNPKLAALKELDANLWRQLPVLIRLRDFKTRSFEAVTPAARLAEIEEIVRGSARAEGPGAVSDSWERGRACLIFDGLDELESDAARKAFAHCLKEWLSGQRQMNSVMVTTRPTAYPPADPQPSARQRWDLPGFSLWELELMDPAQQLEFLESWFRWRAPRDKDPQAAAKNLRRQIIDHRLEDLAQDPLLLAGLARLAVSGGAAPTPLPETRAAVFDRILHFMLTKWQAAREEVEESLLERLLQDLLLRVSDLRELLARMALLSLKRRRQVGDFDRAALERALVELAPKRPRSGEKNVRPVEDQVRALVNELAEHSGLVRPLERSESGDELIQAFEFPVRPYRNYLAGESLFKALPKNSADDARAAFETDPFTFGVFCVEHGLLPVLGLPAGAEFNADHAGETISLGLARQAQQLGSAPFLEAFRLRIEQYQAEGKPAFALIRAAATLALDAKAWTPGRDEGPCRLHVASPGTWNLPKWRERSRLAMHSAAESLADRAAAGSLAGLLSEAPDFSRALPVDWCAVGSDGRLRFRRDDGSRSGGGGANSCDLVRQAFYMSRFPVTVDDYEAYVRLAPQASRPTRLETRHSLWRTPVFHTPNHPVVGVSWENATSYGRWMTDEIRAGRLPVPVNVERDRSAWEIRLPEEWEWELAARGPEEDEPSRPPGDEERFRVPWGWATADGIRAHANCENLITWTSAVDLFFGAHQPPRNASSFDIVDLVGNVWEWCQTPWGEEGEGRYPAHYEGKLQEVEKEPGSHRVVRGGGWDSAPADCRCAYRFADHPGGRNYDLGFRLVLAPVPPGASGARVV